EQQLGPATATPGAADTVIVASTMVPVSLRVRVGDVAPQGPNTFSISAPGGGPLIDAIVSPADLAEMRVRWRDTVRAAVICIVVLTLLFGAGALLDVRRRARGSGRFAVITLVLLGLAALARQAALLATAVIFAGSALKAPIDLLLTALTCVAVVWVAL